MEKNRSSRSIFFLVIVAVLTLTLATLAVFAPKIRVSAASTIITFDFDAGSPSPSEGQSTPLNLTVSGVTVSFSSPSDPAAFSIQSYDTTFLKLSQFNGKYLYDNKPSRDILDIKFNQSLDSINLTFATIEFHGGPGVEPSNITLTAYMDSTGTTPIASAIARGTWPSSDSYPQGTLSFNSSDQPFNLVRIQLPYQGPVAAVDFLVDNIKVTEAPVISEFPTAMILPLYIVVITLAVFLAKRKISKTFR